MPASLSYLRGQIEFLSDARLRELSEAEFVILQHEQDYSFGRDKVHLTTGPGMIRKGSDLVRLDPIMFKGTLRVGGRLQNSGLCDSVKHPIILPAKGKVTDFLIQQTHEEVGHGGRQHVLSELRKRYWIIKGTSAVKRVIGNCFQCRRVHGQPEKKANLPRDRVCALEPPFTNTGIDLFGPFFVSRGRSHVKKYGVIFSCLITMAVHLEVVCSLSTDSFMCALRRFFSKKGSGQGCQVRSGYKFGRC